VVVLNRWPVGKLCASCFDVLAEQAKKRRLGLAAFQDSFA